ncbi:hypothetical protein HZA55_04150 [Candidatus Poribacteria bacterium]|nr:hypothetical protein [Candidatus Poribacteria bacterium]
MNTIASNQKDFCLSFVFNNPSLAIEELKSYGFTEKSAKKLLSERSSVGGKFYSFDDFEGSIALSEKELKNIIANIINNNNVSAFRYEFHAWKSWEPKPVIILIHGHGLSKNSWIDPHIEKIKDCNLKFKHLLTDYRHNPKEKNAGVQTHAPRDTFLQFGLSKPLEYLELPPKSLWEFFKESGYNVVTWSQKEPNQSIEKALKELSSYVIPATKKIFNTKDVILIGHGRGGLIARKYTELYQDKRHDVSGIIMMGTPNYGTNISQFAKELSILFSSLCIFIDEEAPLSTIASTVLNGVPEQQEMNLALFDEAIEKQALLIKNIKTFFNELRTFLTSEALTEMASTSELISKIKDKKESGVYYASICGTENTFTKMYLWFYKPTSFIPHNKNKSYQWTIIPKEIAKIFDIVEKLLPRILIPREFIKNKGDGLVSLDSAKWHLSDETHVFHLNHLDLLVNYNVKEKILEILEKIQKKL